MHPICFVLRKFCKFFYLSIALISVQSATAQPSAREKVFLEQVMGDSHITYYTNGFYKGIKNAIREHLLVDSIVDAAGHLDAGKQRKIIFTKTEKKQIAKQIDVRQNRGWYKHVLPNARLIERDSIDSVGADLRYGWLHVQKKYPFRIYEFMRPIFLRKNLCIFGFGGTYSSFEIIIYQYDGKNWRPWLYAFSVIS